MKEEILSVERGADGLTFSVGEYVCINESFPRQIVEFKIINDNLYAGFDYGKEEGIMYNQIHELKKDKKIHIDVQIKTQIEQAKDEKERLDRKIQDLIIEFERNYKGVVFDSVWVKRDQVGSLIYVESVIKLS